MDRRKFIGTGVLALVGCKQKKYTSSFSLHGNMILSGTVQASTQPIRTRSGNNARTGVYIDTTLTAAAVATQGVGKIFSLPMEGDAVGAEAQLLIEPDVTLTSDRSQRDVAIQCSMNNTVWAYDANTSDDLWMQKLGIPVKVTTQIDSYLVNDHAGIYSTPVTYNGKLYVVAWQTPDQTANNALYYMHVLNLADGSAATPPVLVQGTSNGQVFNSMLRKQRSSLIEVGGVVFFACGTVYESSAGAAGWIFAYDTGTNTFSASLAVTQGNGAGIWMGGAGLTYANGYLYAITGNGAFDGVENFGEAFIKIAYTNGVLSIVDDWAGWTDQEREGNASAILQGPDPGFELSQKKLDQMRHDQKIAGTNGSTDKMPVSGSPYEGWYDEDLGSGGLVYDVAHNFLIGGGKDGILYVLNASNLGHTQAAAFSSATAKAANYGLLAFPPEWGSYFPGYQYNPAPAVATTLDFLGGGLTRHLHSTPILWQSATHGTICFVWGENSPVRAWSVTLSGLIYLGEGNELASASVKPPGGMPGGFMALSWDGANDATAVLWACIPIGDANKTRTPGRFLAYNASTFPNQVVTKIWDSQMYPGLAYTHNKFNNPVVDSGKVFVPTYNDRTDAYSLA